MSREPDRDRTETSVLLVSAELSLLLGSMLDCASLRSARKHSSDKPASQLGGANSARFGASVRRFGLYRHCRGSHDETCPSQILESGRERCRAASRVADREGASLS